MSFFRLLFLVLYIKGGDFNMKYDFESVISRKNTGSEKWNGMYKKHKNIPDDIVPLSVADMEFKNPPEIGEALSEYFKNSVMGYTEPQDSYYNAVISWFKRRHNWNIEKEWILDYPGVVPALYHIVNCFTEKDEGVIIFTPVYYPFYSAIKSGGRNIVECSLVENNGEYKINFEDFENKAKDSKNTLCIMCNPHNPVGRVWTKEELEKIGDICIKNNIKIVSDEIHNDIIMPGYNHTVFASISEEFQKNSIICTAPSKTFNTAGLMTSNIIISDYETRKKLYKYRMNNGVFGCNMAGYKACEVAYNKCEEWLSEFINVIDRNRIFVENFIKENIPEIKVSRLEGTYLMWLDCRQLGMGYIELEKFMIEKALLFNDEGYIFGEGGKGFERINIACPLSVISQAMERLKKALDNIKK